MEHFDNWSTAIDVVSSQFYDDRPGKASAVKYLILFEYTLRNGEGSTYTHPVYHKFVANPENAVTEPIRELSVDMGVRPSSAPYITWTSIKGNVGTIVVSAGTSNSIFINRTLGEGGWQEVKTMAGRAYSREAKIPANDMGYLHLAGGAEEGQSSPSQILAKVMDFEAALQRLGRE
ncbi:glycoside hydrolase family 93 protein [Zopfia rhizophila CBS 207.26]|uniref:Glycoside hydrolase family 93 protein n=1 Tax=Zopfia rhizophila CBS 207.26 TaxID=1314779 RepID=A0A6A6E6X8_9PEZI|nr:glycoside hydrolase family 93 protein [Zopfia rhizophila CBS 207.26]